MENQKFHDAKDSEEEDDATNDIVNDASNVCGVNSPERNKKK